MPTAQELYREGRLSEAIAALQSLLRDQPGDKRARSFLFELLCFAGEFERARKQLTALGEDAKESKLGIAFYFAALRAEEERQAYYQNPPPAGEGEAPSPPAEAQAPVSGRCNGKAFSGIRDLDPRLGDSLEFLAAGKYQRMAYRYLAKIEFSAPTRVRDLYWLPANAQTTSALGSTDLESILVPVLYPFSYLFDDDQTRLGRSTDWTELDGEEIPCGQRVLIIGGEEVPLVSLRTLEFDQPAAAAGGESGHE
jgi:type VI secretion system protein ImpE